MKVTVFYVGSSLLGPFRQAERDINARYGLGLAVACHNCTLPLEEAAWTQAERDVADADIVFVIHITDNENAARIAAALDRHRARHYAVIVINCLRELMQRTRLGALELFAIFDAAKPAQGGDLALRFLRKVGSWMGNTSKGSSAKAGKPPGHSRGGGPRRPERYLKLLRQAPAILRFIPSRGTLGGIKHYLTLFCYFLQPTPANIRSMILYAIQQYMPGYRKRVQAEPPESRPAVGIYHPEAPALFASFREYRKWYTGKRARAAAGEKLRLEPEETVGLLLLRPQIVSGAHGHYDRLIQALEAEGLSVIPVISTFMDNREACQEFLVGPSGEPRVSQLLSLTGFSFVGGPAMNDSKAAVAFLKNLNRPLRSAVSLEMQRTEDWAGSMVGLNPVQTAMQVAIPEIDGATEPFVYGGLPAGKDQPEALEDRCRRLARRVSRWNRLRRLPRSEVRLGAIVYCFPPNKGNLGTAADLDVFPSVWEMLQRLRAEGYHVDVPESPELLREMLLGGNHSGELASVAYRLTADEYYRLCPYVEEIEAEWGPAPGRINAQGRSILIHGIELGNLFLGIQPTFGYEGDPMRLLFAKGGAPHHGFMGLYTYLDKIFHADALVHVGTHGALEFMPGKQVGLSEACWPDRLIGEFPNIYIYSVNNPSEGTIAKRRSYAELISYLTPPIENAGLYKELASLKELVGAYRQTRDEKQREQLFVAIGEKAKNLNLSETAAAGRN